MGSPGTQVRYEIPSNPSWMNLASGMAHGVGNYAQNIAQKDALQQEQDRKVALSLITAMAQQNRLPTGPAPAGQPWAMPFTAAPTDWTKAENEVDYYSKLRDYNDPDFAVQQGAAKQALAQAALDGSDEGVFRALQGINAMKTGVGREVPGKKPFLWDKGTPATRQRLDNNQIITEYKNDDGSWSIEPQSKKDKKKQPAPTKYKIGQIISTPKGNFVVTGGDLNNNPDIEPAAK